MSDVSAVTNHFSTSNEGFFTTTSLPITAGAAIVPFASTSGLTNNSIFVGIIEPGQTKQQTFTGTVDTVNNQITNVHWTRGTNADHAVGVTVVDYVTGTDHNMMTKGILVQHKQDGSHSAVTADSLTTATVAATSDVTVGGNLTVTGTSRSIPVTTAGSSTITPSAQMYDVTALNTNATVAVPSFAANNGQALILRIKDNGTPRTLSFASGYTNVSGLTTPTTTVASKLLTIGALYNSATSKWEIQGINQEA